MSRQAWRYYTLPQNTAKIKQFCKKYNFEMKSLNNGYQLRIEGVLDLYPVRAKYHNLTNHERGEWETLEDLRKIMLKALEVRPLPIKIDSFSGGLDMSNDGNYTLKEQPQVMNIISMPAPKKLWPRLILAKIKRALKW